MTANVDHYIVQACKKCYWTRWLQNLPGRTYSTLQQNCTPFVVFCFYCGFMFKIYWFVWFISTKLFQSCFTSIGGNRITDPVNEVTMKDGDSAYNITVTPQGRQYTLNQRQLNCLFNSLISQSAEGKQHSTLLWPFVREILWRLLWFPLLRATYAKCVPIHGIVMREWLHPNTVVIMDQHAVGNNVPTPHLPPPPPSYTPTPYPHHLHRSSSPASRSSSRSSSHLFSKWPEGGHARP